MTLYLDIFKWFSTYYRHLDNGHVMVYYKIFIYFFYMYKTHLSRVNFTLDGRLIEENINLYI